MKRASLSFVVLALCFVEQAVAGAMYAVSTDGAVVVRLTDAGTPIAANTLGTSAGTAFGDAFPTWTATAGAGGSISVDTDAGGNSLVRAGFKSGMGGAEFLATYLNGGPLAAGQKNEWVQVITTNDPLGNRTSPYLDNAGKEEHPFYTYTAVNNTLQAPNINFYDFSTRAPADMATVGPISWKADLYPVIWNGATTLTVKDGLSWGWTMKKATVGTTAAPQGGIFTNPAPATAVVAGVGTSTFYWGADDPTTTPDERNWLSFSGGVFDTTPGTAFKLGRLTYHNGSVPVGTEATSIDFNLGLNFDNVPEKNFVFRTTFNINNTVNNGVDPLADADSISLGNFGFTFRVLEGATASADLFAKLATNLAGTPSGGVPADHELRDPPPEVDGDPDYLASIVGFRNPSPGGFVPEPPTLLLVALCLALLRGFRRDARPAFA